MSGDVVESHRPHLLGVGYRITGSIADAEDAVQEAWLRLAALDDPDQIRDLRGWLTTVVARLCLDRLRSAAARRERYVGPWLPEPLVTTSDDDGPLAHVVRDEGVRMAAMVVLDALSPAQRVAFVLHEALAEPYDSIAEVLGCSTAAARQHASRARRALADAAPPPRAADSAQQAVLGRFADALGRGDVAALVALLHPDVVLRNDGGGRVQAALRPVVGADKVARLLLGLHSRYGDGMLDGRAVRVNGEPGWLVPGAGAVSTSVTVFALADDRIVGVYSTLNPEKLTRLPA
ncbi:RNA polymerase sigma-70 factor (ECF subfamily) [Pseudonocardia sediminis]|uniref:RNA polymerase sigma-70 factor (ECF subfamily) n=1 Tax=Pseudonocardia sediminis TaxID=1397368 RepID=A0A4Q7V4N2_PSEST|nr:RNA polymerase sigma factor SigJ [Pseudonocardia sediminis]RZT87579.1 RNA polymerase sigma-70 factor (ECF subfamily) [Pseudonocardia sediminis]